MLLSTLKNGNLVANAVVGAALLGKRYSASQLLAVSSAATSSARRRCQQWSSHGQMALRQIGLRSSGRRTRLKDRVLTMSC